MRDTFGERPDEPWAREEWENAVRQVARYRAQYEITDPSDALGPRPEQSVSSSTTGSEPVKRSSTAERRLGRDVETERDVDLGIGF